SFDHQGTRSTLLESALADPLKLTVMPGMLDDGMQVMDAADVASKVLSNLSRWQGQWVRRHLVGQPLDHARSLATGDTPLVGAVERVFKLGGSTMPDDVRDQVKNSFTGAPLELQKKLAVLIHAMCDAQEWSSVAADAFSEPQWKDLLDYERNV